MTDMIIMKDGKPLFENNTYYTKLTKYVSFSEDSLTIYDGRFNTSPLLGEFCGDTVPPLHISSGNQIYLHFATWKNPGSTEDGFKLEYAPYSKSKFANFI